MEAKTLYFAYGSNMDAGLMKDRCPQAELAAAPAWIDGYKLDFRRLSKRWQAGVADIVASAEGRVYGCLWELPESELTTLDRKEGVAIGAYRRLVLAVSTHERVLSAVSYTVVEKTLAPIPPAPAYAQLMLAGALALGLPPAYRAQLQAQLHSLGVITAKP